MSKSLPSLLAAGALLSLTACFPKEEEEKADSGPAETNNDDGKDEPDTAIMSLYRLGAGTITPATEETPASFAGTYSYAWYGPEVEEWVCVLTADWTSTGEPAKEGCPDCVWAFDLDVTNSLTDGGPACEQSAAYGYGDGDLDDPTYYWNTTWGLTNDFDYDGTGAYILEQAILLSYKDDWYVSFFNFAQNGWEQIRTEDSFEQSFYAYSPSWTDTGIKLGYYYP